MENYYENGFLREGVYFLDFHSPEENFKFCLVVKPYKGSTLLSIEKGNVIEEYQWFPSLPDCIYPHQRINMGRKKIIEHNFTPLFLELLSKTYRQSETPETEPNGKETLEEELETPEGNNSGNSEE